MATEDSSSSTIPTELNSDSTFEFTREGIDTNAIDIELDSESADVVNSNSTTDLDAKPSEAEPILNSIPSVFFEASSDEHEPLYSEADFTFNTEISAEIADFDDPEAYLDDSELEGFSDTGLTENISFAGHLVDRVDPENSEDADDISDLRSGLDDSISSSEELVDLSLGESSDSEESFEQKKSQAQAYVVEIGEISEFEEPVIVDDPTIGFRQTDLSPDLESVDSEGSGIDEPPLVDDPTIGFSQTNLAVELEPLDDESSIIAESAFIDDPTVGFSQTDLSVEIESADTESSIIPVPERTDIDSIPDQNSALVRENHDDVVSVEDDSETIIVKPKGVFKRLFGRAVSWIKRFVGF